MKVSGIPPHVPVPEYGKGATNSTNAALQYFVLSSVISTQSQLISSSVAHPKLGRAPGEAPPEAPETGGGLGVASSGAIFGGPQETPSTNPFDYAMELFGYISELVNLTNERPVPSNFQQQATALLQQIQNAYNQLKSLNPNYSALSILSPVLKDLGDFSFASFQENAALLVPDWIGGGEAGKSGANVLAQIYKSWLPQNISSQQNPTTEDLLSLYLMGMSAMNDADAKTASMDADFWGFSPQFGVSFAYNFDKFICAYFWQKDGGSDSNPPNAQFLTDLQNFFSMMPMSSTIAKEDPNYTMAYQNLQQDIQQFSTDLRRYLSLIWPSSWGPPSAQEGFVRSDWSFWTS